MKFRTCGNVIRIPILIAGMAISGCSSIVNEKSTGINIEAPGCPDGTECTLKHKKGHNARVPTHVTIPKSDDPLHIECRTSDGRIYVNAAESRMGAMIWGNVVFGGGIGAIVDAHTDAHRIYPHTIKVPMCQPGRENDPPDVTFPE